MSDVSSEDPPFDPNRVVRPQRRGSAGDTVTIACNWPNGVLMQLYSIEVVEQCYPNGKTYKEHVSTVNTAAGQYHVHGCSLDYAAIASGGLPDHRVIKSAAPGTGYALTSGIPRDFAEEWFRQNADSPLVKPRDGSEPSIFMMGSESRAVAGAREYKNGKSGFQGLNPDGDYRVPSGRNIRRYNPNDNRITPEQADINVEQG